MANPARDFEAIKNLIGGTGLRPSDLAAPEKTSVHGEPKPTSGLKIVKRTGDVVLFDAQRIRNAMEKAFRAVRRDPPAGLLDNLVSNVADEVTVRFREFFPNVENVQDIVEKNLVVAGEYEVAKAYILYRAERQRVREEKRQVMAERARLGRLTVTGDNNRMFLFNVKKVEQVVRGAARDLSISVDLVVQEVIKSVYDGIPTAGIANALVLAASSFVERDPAYSKLASRLLRRKLLREVIPDSAKGLPDDAAYRTAFMDNILEGVQRGLLDRRLADFDLQRLAAELHPERDDLIEYLGMQTLFERYLLKTDKRILELPQALWMRVSMGTAVEEPNPTERALEFYELLSNLRYIPSTPTLFHAGTPHPQLSSCYLTTVQDDLHHIFKSLSDNAQLSKWSGGIGNDWSAIRATGSPIKSTHVESQGVIPFLKIANDVTVAINRSGKRRGATCAYLETWHYDIEDFLALRKNTGDERRRTHDMNTANWVPDLFMKRVEEEGEWTLFSSDEVPDLHELSGKAFEERYLEYEGRARNGEMCIGKSLPAKDLWRKMLTMLFETGHPWITFKDTCNIRSPQDHDGVVHSSNLCTEITLNTSADETAVCNLGSINLARHIADGDLNEELLASTVRSAIRMLDNVIDINFYPTSEAKRSNMRHRPVGLGQMGLQDALFLQNLPFESDDALEFVDRVSEFISYHAILASSELAKERGAYASYPGSKWDRGIFPLDTLDLLEQERGVPVEVDRTSRMDWTPVREHVAQHGMRNSNTMAIAPTATISNISGCFPCIEPIFKNIYVKANISGEFTIVNRYLVDDLKALGMWNDQMLERLKYLDGSLDTIPELPDHVKAKYREAFEVDPLWAVRMSAVRGKWIDQSQSHNVFMKGVSGKLLSDIYMTAWKMGLKTTYYLRTLAATQIEKSTVDAGKYGFTQKRSYNAANGNGDSGNGYRNGAASNGSPADGAVHAASNGAAGNGAAGNGAAGNGAAGDGVANGHANGKANGAVSPGSEPKLCRIDDPDCEACQ